MVVSYISIFLFGSSLKSIFGNGLYFFGNYLLVNEYGMGEDSMILKNCINQCNLLI